MPLGYDDFRSIDLLRQILDKASAGPSGCVGTDMHGGLAWEAGFGALLAKARGIVGRSPMPQTTPQNVAAKFDSLGVEKGAPNAQIPVADLILSATVMHEFGDTQGAVEALLAGPRGLLFMIEAARLFARWDTPEAALEMGRRISALYPDDPNGPFNVAGALRRLKRAGEAEETLHDAPTRWASNAPILSIWASLPMHRAAWDEALGRWNMLIKRFPDSPKFPAMKARCLIFAGRLDESSSVIQAALRDFPPNGDCETVRAEVEKACRRRDGTG